MSLKYIQSILQTKYIISISVKLHQRSIVDDKVYYSFKLIFQISAMFFFTEKICWWLENMISNLYKPSYLLSRI